MNTRTKDIAAARGKPTHSSVPDNPESTLTEDALSNSQAHLSCAFQDAAIGMALVGLDGHWLQVNPALCKLVGYTQPELLATTFQAITHPDDLDTDLAFVRQVLASEIPTYQMEKRYFHKQGHIVWILLDVSLVRDPATHPLFFIAQIQDISKRKWAEEALRTSQEMLHQALQASNTGLWVWNTESNEVSYSKEWKGQLGYKEAELTDDFQTWETRLHPDDHAQAMTYLRAYTAQPVGDYQYEFRLRHKDGTYRWIETRATFVTEPDGRQIRLLGSHTDITARKHMETTLRESEAWHQTMIEAIPQQVWTARPDGTLEYVNRRVLDYFGCQEDDLLGWEWESVLHPDDLPACQESWCQR
ncbi:MAG: hybrid sensor histidine kinase/response regulator [Nitrospira sp.]|nr:MAG: hybrid sensor histidine kinase/response regulator [Nitrospira sp.]